MNITTLRISTILASIICIAYYPFLSTKPNLQIVTQSKATAKVGFGDWNIATDGEALLMQYLLEPGDVIFDVGCNLGEWSSLALEIMPDIKLFSFEPVPEAYIKLKELFKVHNNVHVFNVGLSNNNGSSNFYYYCDTMAQWGLSGFYYREVLHGDLAEPLVIKIDHQTIDDFCAEHNIQEIKFLKIDTEGSEWNILNGAHRMLRNHAIKAVQFEYGGCYIDAKTTLEQVIRFLTENDYVVFRVFNKGLIHINQWTRDLENYDLSNYCALRKEDVPDYTLTIFS
jgi:FkbM family methyltransferase